MWPFELLSGRLSAHGTHKTRAEIEVLKVREDFTITEKSIKTLC